MADGEKDAKKDEKKMEVDSEVLGMVYAIIIYNFEISDRLFVKVNLN